MLPHRINVSPLLLKTPNHTNATLGSDWVGARRVLIKVTKGLECVHMHHLISNHYKSLQLHWTKMHIWRTCPHTCRRFWLHMIRANNEQYGDNPTNRGCRLGQQVGPTHCARLLLQLWQIKYLWHLGGHLLSFFFRYQEVEAVWRGETKYPVWARWGIMGIFGGVGRLSFLTRLLWGFNTEQRHFSDVHTRTNARLSIL